MTRAAFRDRAIYLPDAETLVVADLHVGRGEASDVEFPLGEADNLRERLVALLDRYAPREVVFAGDVLHQFSRVSDRVARSLDDLTEACRTAGTRPVMVAGNHDARLDTLWSGPIHDAYRIDASDTNATPASDGVDADDSPTDATPAAGADDTTPATGVDDAHDTDDPAVPTGEYAPSLSSPIVVRHGHEAPPESETRTAGTYLVGHDHPTAEIEGRRRPCYLHVPSAAGDADAVMLPAFNRLPAGVAVNEMRGDDFQSPFVTAPNEARPLVWDGDAGRVLPFPPLGAFRRFL